jgi:hypothetical protein
MKMQEIDFEALGKPQAQPEDEVKFEVEAPPAESNEPEVEIEDDTPKKDRGRKASEPPADVTDDELNEYSKRAQDRIKHFTKGYHDERRAKEQALREREAAEALAKAAYERLKKLEAAFNQTQKIAYGATKNSVEAELQAATRAYKEAYEAGDADALMEANLRLIDAKQAADRMKTEPQGVQETLQPDFDEVYSKVRPAQEPAVDDKAVEWHSQNPWFRKEPDMTAYAEGLHNRLISKGVDPTSDEYYATINSRMRQAFPDYEWGDSDDTVEVEEEQPPVRRAENKPASIVAPATRSTAPKKIRLTASQAAVARRLGVPLEEYAKQLAQMNGGR